ncbi:hypothetical protein FCULG_00007196 [Fusarium culmorum]|uniref:RNA-dependent RNA polymerase n=1 Tax=Fusarium culmorum TaxID=5516 RepID=A0A2T4GV89_FUSCU|nr:hypothetical protein FCULG_00007196 [Fusarium culmorum]
MARTYSLQQVADFLALINVPSQYRDPEALVPIPESLRILHTPRCGPGTESSVGRHSAYRTTNQATNATRQFDRPPSQSDLGFLSMENMNPTLSESRKLIFEAMICDDRYSTKSSIHDDDSDGSEYSVSSSLADAMAQVWNSNDSSQQYQVPRKQPDAVSDQSTQTKEHNVLPYSVLMGNLATTWPSCPPEMDHAPQIVKWEMHRIAQHCSVTLENTSVQYTPAWEDQTLFRDAVKEMRCFKGKSFPEPCDAQVWHEGFTDSFQPREAVIFKALLHLDLEAGDVRLNFEIPTLDKRCRLRRKFASDRFVDLRLLITNRPGADNLEKALARWLVNSRHMFLSREWAAFFIDDVKIKTTSAAAEWGFTEEQQVILFAERGLSIGPYVVRPATLTEAQPPVTAWKNTKDKMRIEISQSTWALMVVDFQGVLGPDEVQLCFSSPFNDGFEQRYDLEGFDVIVARCPAHLPSDIQKVKAVFKPELRHLKDVVVFPFIGQEPLAGKLSGVTTMATKLGYAGTQTLSTTFEIPKCLKNRPSMVESLILKHGKSHYLDYLLEEAFTFHLTPKLVGLCTNYKERLAYDKNSIEDPSVINMSWLLSALVDQPKSGFTFNKEILQRFQKEYCENQVDLKQPAYKKGTIGRISKPCHIFDFLKYKMQEIIHQGLSDLYQYRSSQNGDSGTLDVPTFDKDLASYWNEFEAEAMNLIHQQDSGSNWLSDMRSNLKRDIDTCYSYWVEVMSGPNGKANYLAKVASVHERWVSISPQIAKRSAVAEAVICTLSRPSTHSPELGTWQLLKASLTFKLYHKTRKFLWCIAGRQLQFIKASKVRAPIPVTPRTYKVLRPDGKRIHQSCVNEDRMVAEDNW